MINVWWTWNTLFPPVLGCISIQFPFLQIDFIEGNQVNISWKASSSWSRAKLVQAYLTCQSVCWLLQVSKAATAIDPGELLDSLGWRWQQEWSQWWFSLVIVMVGVIVIDIEEDFHLATAVLDVLVILTIVKERLWYCLGGGHFTFPDHHASLSFDLKGSSTKKFSIA